MTDRMNDIATLITQLRVVGQLTRTEAQVARLRVAQASSDAVRDELRQNAVDADGRAARIAGALHDLGALPDPVTPLFGRVAALVRGALEQAQPLDEAVLGDLALEHQLRDRARYVGALAEATGRPDVGELADHLVAAHTETIEWLDGLLADLGAGRPAALGASPLQQVAAQVTHVANAPARSAWEGALDRTVHTATKVAGAARDTATQAVDKVTEVTGQAVGGAVQAADKVTEVAGQAVGGAVQAAATTAGAVQDGAAQVLNRSADAAAGAAEETAEAAADAAEETAEAAAPAAPPIPGFADLPAHAAVAALRSLDDPREVEAILEFEQAHGDRPGVVAAARLRAAALRSG